MKQDFHSRLESWIRQGRAVIVVATLLAGCVRSNIVAPVVPQAPREVPRWLERFHDPLVLELAPRVLSSNDELEVQRARVIEARARARESWATLLPSLSLNGEGYRGNDGLGGASLTSIGGMSGELAWEVDLFGATTVRAKSAEADVQGVQYTAEHIELLTLAELLESVVSWREAQTTIGEVTELLETQDEQIGLIRNRVEMGLLDSAALERATAQRLQTASTQSIAHAQALRAQHQMEFLVGEVPHGLTSFLTQWGSQHSSPSRIYDLPPPSIEGLESLSLSRLRRRPDVLAAYHGLLRANYELKASERDLWPRVSIGAAFGAQERDSSPFAAGNPLWSIASGVTAPLFNFGRLRARVDASDARARSAVAQYEQTVRRAAQEVHTALAAVRHRQEGVMLLRESLEHRKETVAILEERFRRGLVDMIPLTTAQAELDQVTLTLIEQTAALNRAAITAHRAVVVVEGS